MKKNDILKKAAEMYADPIHYEGKTYHMVDKEGGTDIDETTFRAQVICEDDFSEGEGFPLYTMEWKRDPEAVQEAMENGTTEWDTGFDVHEPNDVWEDEGYFTGE